jgi:hypothetical protein
MKELLIFSLVSFGLGFAAANHYDQEGLQKAEQAKNEARESWKEDEKVLRHDLDVCDKISEGRDAILKKRFPHLRLGLFRSRDLRNRSRLLNASPNFASGYRRLPETGYRPTGAKNVQMAGAQATI